MGPFPVIAVSMADEEGPPLPPPNHIIQGMAESCPAEVVRDPKVCSVAQKKSVLFACPCLLTGILPAKFRGRANEMSGSPCDTRNTFCHEVSKLPGSVTFGLEGKLLGSCPGLRGGAETIGITDGAADAEEATKTLVAAEGGDDADPVLEGARLVPVLFGDVGEGEGEGGANAATIPET